MQQSTPRKAPVVEAPARRGLAVTRRAVAVLAVLFILLFSYLNSLRVYFHQKAEIESTRERIAAEKKAIEDLKDEKARWEDPDYVKTQARIRLGWVVPGETGYKVIGADGKPLGNANELDTTQILPSGEHPQLWWERLLGSIKAADEPAAGDPSEKPTSKAPATVKYHTPTPSPTPTKRR